MKIALLQLNLVTGDINGNARRIADAVRAAAERGADLCLTPDSALCGPQPQSMLAVNGFVTACRDALYALAWELAELPPVLVGAPVAALLPEDGRVCGAAVLLQGGKVDVVARRALPVPLPPGDAAVLEQGSAGGLITVRGRRIGVLLHDASPGDELFKRLSPAGHPSIKSLNMRGVDMLAHLGAVPFTADEQELREHRLSHIASRYHIHVLSSNLVGGNGCDVYHGQSAAFGPDGTLLGRGKIFEEDCLLVDDTGSEPAQIAQRGEEDADLWGALCLGVRDYVRKSGFQGVLLGLSGGLDSAVTAAAAVDALGADQVLGVLLPSPWTSENSVRWAEELADKLGIRHVSLPIAPLMAAYETALEPAFARLGPANAEICAENVQPRIRADLLMALANAYGLLLLNTGNKSEAAVGYSTLYGDATGALAVIGDISKSRVYALARWYNARQGRAVIPEAVISRPPSAELKADQLDSDSLPPYDILDPLLARIMGEEGAVPEGDAPEEQALAVDVYAKMRTAEFKRRQSPPALRVSRRAFGRDWILPLVSRYTT